MTSGLMLFAECDQPFVPARVASERLMEWVVALPETGCPPAPRNLALVVDASLGAVLGPAAFATLGAADRLAACVVNGSVRAVAPAAPVTPAHRRALAMALDVAPAASTGAALTGGWLDAGMAVAASTMPGGVGGVVLLIGDQTGGLYADAVALRAQMLRQAGVCTAIVALGERSDLPLLARLAAQGGGRLYPVADAAAIVAALRAEWARLAGIRAVDAALLLTVPSRVTLDVLGGPHVAQGDARCVSLGALSCRERRRVYTRVFVPAGACGEPIRLSAEVVAAGLPDGAPVRAEAAQALVCTAGKSDRPQRRVRAAAAQVEFTALLADAQALERLGRRRQAEFLLAEGQQRLRHHLDEPARAAGHALAQALARLLDVDARGRAYGAAYRALCALTALPR